MMFIGYVTFMSIVYFTDANFVFAGVAVTVVMIALFYLVMRIQKLKAASHNFDKNIVKERILLIVFLVVCCALFTQFVKFWSVQGNKDAIESCFVECTNGANDLFMEYERYSELRKARIDSISKTAEALKGINASKAAAQQEFSRAMELQLTPPAYLRFREESKVWLQSASNGVSVWNVFLFGNIRNFRTTVHNWHTQLQQMSEHKMACEGEETLIFDSKNVLIDNLDNNLLLLGNAFHVEGFHPLSLTGIVGFLLLLFPYLVQYRYTKSTYTLFGRSKSYMEWKKKQIEIETSEVHIDHVVNEIGDIGDSKQKRTHNVTELNEEDSDQTRKHVVVTEDVDKKTGIKHVVTSLDDDLDD